MAIKIAVGISTAEIARYAVFYDSFMHVTPPANVIITAIQARGANIAENRNIIAKLALDSNCDYVWYLDDDQVLAPDTLIRLLAHDKDIVSGLYLHREPPFSPQVYDRVEGVLYHPRCLNPLERGLVSALATGAGCMLVKIDVFKKLERPWWRLGQITKDGWGDDLDFCRRAIEAEFKVWCDLDTIVGHQMNGTVWPVYNENGEWATVLVQRAGVPPTAIFPPAKSSLFVL